MENYFSLAIYKVRLRLKLRLLFGVDGLRHSRDRSKEIHILSPRSIYRLGHRMRSLFPVSRKSVFVFQSSEYIVPFVLCFSYRVPSSIVADAFFRLTRLFLGSFSATRASMLRGILLSLAACYIAVSKVFYFRGLGLNYSFSRSQPEKFFGRGFLYIAHVRILCLLRSPCKAFIFSVCSTKQICISGRFGFPFAWGSIYGYNGDKRVWVT